MKTVGGLKIFNQFFLLNFEKIVLYEMHDFNSIYKVYPMIIYKIIYYVKQFYYANINNVTYQTCSHFLIISDFQSIYFAKP